jgi:hypothetical protein
VFPSLPQLPPILKGEPLEGEFEEVDEAEEDVDVVDVDVLLMEDEPLVELLVG